jgi:hypothetical protein
MQRIVFIAATVVAVTLTTALGFAQTSPPASPPQPQSSLTPEQHEQMRGFNAAFAACHNKAVAAKVAPESRRAFIKSCLAGSK